MKIKVGDRFKWIEKDNPTWKNNSIYKVLYVDTSGDVWISSNTFTSKVSVVLSEFNIGNIDEYGSWEKVGDSEVHEEKATNEFICKCKSLLAGHEKDCVFYKEPEVLPGGYAIKQPVVHTYMTASDENISIPLSRRALQLHYGEVVSKLAGLPFIIEKG